MASLSYVSANCDCLLHCICPCVHTHTHVRTALHRVVWKTQATLSLGSPPSLLWTHLSRLSSASVPHKHSWYRPSKYCVVRACVRACVRVCTGSLSAFCFTGVHVRGSLCAGRAQQINLGYVTAEKFPTV